MKRPWPDPNDCSLVWSIQELSWACISVHNLGNPCQNWLKMGYPGLSQVILQSHAGISMQMGLHIQSYTKLYPTGISRDIQGYPISGFLYWDIPKQVFYIVLSWDILGQQPRRVIQGYPGQGKPRIWHRFVFSDEYNGFGNATYQPFPTCAIGSVEIKY